MTHLPFNTFPWNYCYQVHHVLLDIVSAAANATPGLGRYPPFKREVKSLSVFKSQRFLLVSQ
jgi:hypothetical protein